MSRGRLDRSAPRFLLIGAGLGIALQVAASDWIHAAAGGGAVVDYVVAALLLLPVLAGTLLTGGGGRRRWLDPYQRSRASRSSRRTFATGWLLWGAGIAACAAVVAAASRIAAPVLDLLFVVDPDVRVLSLLTVLVLALGRFDRRDEPVRAIATVTAICLGLLALFVGRLLWTPPVGGQAAAPLTPVSVLQVTALAAVGLWAVLLAEGLEAGRRRSRSWVVEIVTFVVPLLLMALASWIWQRSAGAERSVGWLFDLLGTDSRVDLLARIAGAALALQAAALLLRTATRFAQAMAGDGMLPLDRRSSVEAPTLVLIAGGAVALDGSTLVGLASLGLLWALAISTWRRWQHPEETAQGARLALSMLACGLAALLPLLLPRAALDLGAIWALGGAAAWLLWASHHARLGDTEGGGVRTGAHAAPLPTENDHALLLLDASTPLSVLRLSESIARGLGLDLLMLRVLDADDLGEGEQRTRLDAARRELETLRSGLDEEERRGVAALVKADASRARAIREAATDHGARLLLLAALDDADAPWLERVLSDTELPVVVGPLAAIGRELQASKVIVGVGGGPFLEDTVRVGESVARALGVELELLAVEVPALSAERCTSLLSQATATVSGRSTSRTLKNTDVGVALISSAGARDVLVVGASIDPLVGQPGLGGVAESLRERREGALIVVKGSEQGRWIWFRRLWRTLSHPFPPLGGSERAEVAAAMRRAATASVDFYVLLLLAAAIASFGLVLDSAATIIGAMLVAPLMSPILALAHGLVLGSLPLMRRGAASVVKGTTGAIAVGIVIAVSSAPRPPTAQMLARGEPSLLDLLVAMASGAAAAYATSRRSVAGALPGVAIAVALVPPLCVTGWAIGAGELGLAGGSLLLFLTNLAGIVLLGAITFALLGVRPSRAERERRVRLALTWTVAALLAVSIPLGLQSHARRRTLRIEREIVTTLLQRGLDERLQDLRVERAGGLYSVDASLSVPRATGADVIEELRRRLSVLQREEVRFRARVQRFDLFEIGVRPLAPGGEPRPRSPAR